LDDQMSEVAQRRIEESPPAIKTVRHRPPPPSAPLRAFDRIAWDPVRFPADVTTPSLQLDSFAVSPIYLSLGVLLSAWALVHSLNFQIVPPLGNACLGQAPRRAPVDHGRSAPTEPRVPDCEWPSEGEVAPTAVGT